MKVQRLEELYVWQDSMQLAEDVYRDLKDCKDWNFKDQIQRAVVSISNNIAEGYEKRTNNEFMQFLFYAKGSCGEVRSMLHLAERIGYLTQAKATTIREQCLKTSSRISRLITCLKKPP